jgi:OsmC-like protein
MALAGCMDGSIRWFADLMEIELEVIDVEVVSRGDVRKLIGLADMPAPSDTGLSMRVNVRAAPGEDPERVDAMLAAAERASGVLSMLRFPVPVALTMESR